MVSKLLRYLKVSVVTGIQVTLMAYKSVNMLTYILVLFYCFVVDFRYTTVTNHQRR